MTTNNTFEKFFKDMISSKAEQIFKSETYVDDHDGHVYPMPKIIGFQVRGLQVMPIYVSEKYSFSVNPWRYDKQDNQWHLSTWSCGGTVMVSQHGDDLELAIKVFNDEHHYHDAQDKDHIGWSKEHLILVRKTEDGIQVEL